MNGATLKILRRQWEQAVLDDDWQAVDRIDAARERIEALQAQARRPAGCVWAGSETCRLCVKSDTCSMSEGAA